MRANGLEAFDECGGNSALCQPKCCQELKPHNRGVLPEERHEGAERGELNSWPY